MQIGDFCSRSYWDALLTAMAYFMLKFQPKWVDILGTLHFFGEEGGWRRCHRERDILGAKNYVPSLMGVLGGEEISSSSIVKTI